MSREEALKNASSNAIVAAARSIKLHFAGSEWLATANRYRVNTATQLETDWKNGQTLPTQPDFSEYVAASVPLHCINGWTYLGHGMEALLRGDEEAALHLGYYSELRATLAFLASRGIAISDQHHFGIDANGTCYHFQKGTHIAAWKALEEWAALSQNSMTLLDLFAVNQRSFSDWISAAVPSATGTGSALAQHWLTSWSLDLQTITDPEEGDRTIRNFVSYRPQHIPAPVRTGVYGNTVERVVSIWEALEPDEVDRFRVIDRYLLRQALQVAYDATFTGVQGGAPDYPAYIRAAMANLGMGGDERLASFLARQSDPDDHILLTLAQTPNAPTSPRALPVLSRAVLLLRIASAATDYLFREAGIDADDLRFWWRAFGDDTGLWEIDADDPDTMTDLWADVGYDAEAAREWIARLGGDASAGRAYREIPGSLLQLARFGRAGLWAVGL
jgi:hypothetical protein